MDKRNKIIIGNCSGFLGDRFSAAAEMVKGGPIDVLTGDYLAELTMAILLKKKLKDPSAGYVSPFLRQMEEIMGECLDRGIKVAVNAGGLNPRGLASALKDLAGKLGLKPVIACITGDDLLPSLSRIREEGEKFLHMDRGIPLEDSGLQPVSANAYLGGWGIARGLELGADIVVGGRIADAALVLGPAAWHFGWKKEEWDPLAGAVAAGHIIECGAQATGGNYSFMEEIGDYRNIGFPLAEIYEDGSFVITKHPGTGGAVMVGTVTAQLLYEVGGPRYLTPDVTARFDTIELVQEGKDRVKGRGTRGTPPPGESKVAVNLMGGFRNSMTVVLTGLDIEKKAEIVERTLFESLGGKEAFETAHVQLIRSDKEDPPLNEEAFALLRLTVMDPDPEKTGRVFSNRVVEMALSSIPGFTLTGPPSGSTPAIRYWPALVDNRFVKQMLEVNGETHEINFPAGKPVPGKIGPFWRELPSITSTGMVKTELGRLYGTRSGDKGGNANLGVWARGAQSFAFLLEYLTADKLRDLLPDLEGYEIERHVFGNLLAVNFIIKGILGEGVAASVRFDPQAKTLGEYLRARVIEVPESMLSSAREKRGGESAS